MISPRLWSGMEGRFDTSVHGWQWKSSHVKKPDCLDAVRLAKQVDSRLDKSPSMWTLACDIVAMVGSTKVASSVSGLKMEAATTLPLSSQKASLHSYHCERFHFGGSFIIGTKSSQITCLSAVCVTQGCCLTIDRCNIYLLELCNFQCAQRTGDLVAKQWNLILLPALNTSSTLNKCCQLGWKL
jgi:hypothetical protein